jgi:hypothetical protein
MTTDERIERLVARHEALTLSVEMLHHEIRDLKEAAGQLAACGRDSRSPHRSS